MYKLLLMLVLQFFFKKCTNNFQLKLLLKNLLYASTHLLYTILNQNTTQNPITVNICQFSCIKSATYMPESQNIVTFLVEK